jgi:hypothetical protein
LLLLQRQLLRLQGLQLLLELLHEIDGAADDGRLVALHTDQKNQTKRNQSKQHTYT